MSIIPEFYKSKDEDYFTVPILKKFIKENINTHMQFYSLCKDDCWKIVESFAEESEHNKEIVFSWIDDTMGEGIQESYIFLRICDSVISTKINSEKGLQKFISEYLTFNSNKHLCENQYNSNLSLVRATLEKGEKDFIKLLFCKKLYYHDTKSQTVTKSIFYPIVAEYYLESGWLIIKAKSKSNLYEYTDVFNETTPKTTTKNEVLAVLKLIENIFGISGTDKNAVSHSLKTSVFNLLDSLVKTPPEIEEIINSLSEQIDFVSDSIIKLCGVKKSKINDANEDIKNLFEKHISINYSDTDVFKKGKVAYPIKLSATDIEETKVETTSACYEPLQTKAAFFDSKKILYSQKMCEGLTLMWKRKSKDSFVKEYIPVKIKVGNWGECIISFRKFTSKEDINNVIWSVIDA